MSSAGETSSAEAGGGVVVLAGLGREGSSVVHGVAAAPGLVRKVYLTASPTRALAGSAELLRIRGSENWREELKGVLAGSRMVVVVSATSGREEMFLPEVLEVVRSVQVFSVAVLVEPLLAGSSYRADEAERLVREATQGADATMVAPADAHGPVPLSVSEAFETWMTRVRSSLAGLLSAACEESINLDLTDVKAVLSGHCRATVGVGEGQSVEEALRKATESSLAPAAELETARAIAARVEAGTDLPLDEARRAGPLLEHMFPKAEIACGIAVRDGLSGVRATVLAAKLDADAVRAQEKRRTLAVESPFFRVGDPTMYDGENLDIPAFVRKDIRLPGSAPRPVPEQKTLFDKPQPIPA